MKLPTVLLGLALWLCLGSANLVAQYQIRLDLDQKSFLSQESLLASVVITNRSGVDTVMGGTANSNWLQFLLEDTSGQQYPPVGVEVEDSFVFPAGKTLKRRIEIDNMASVSDVGTYSVKAVVYHAPTQQFYESNRVRFTVTDPQAIWEQPFGVPPGYDGTGRVRVYSLHSLRVDDGTRLYFRLTDDRSQLKLSTYMLGPISFALDPVFVVDPQNHLQVFFLAAPRIFAHCIIGPDGRMLSRRYYKELEDNRPALVSQEGELVVMGGEIYDPNAAPPPDSETGRSVSDRPPGL